MKVKCYFSQPEPGEKRMEELLLKEKKKSILDGSEDMDGL